MKMELLSEDVLAGLKDKDFDVLTYVTRHNIIFRLNIAASGDY